MNKAFNIFFLFICMEVFFACNHTSNLKYPTTIKLNQVDDYFGTKVSDPYRWLENDTAPNVKQWVTTQANFTEDYLAKIPFRESIKKNIERIMDYPKFSSAFKAGEYIFFKKNDGLQNQAVWYYQKGLNGTPQLFIDPNQLSKDGTVSLVLDGPSYDKKYMAYHINRNGSDWFTSYLVDIATHTTLTDSIAWMKYSGINAWAGNGFYYMRYPKPADGKALTGVSKNPKIYFHIIGEKQENDEFVYDDPANPNFFLIPQTSEDGQFLYVNKSPLDNVEIWGRRIEDKSGPFKLLVKGYDAQYYIMGNLHDTLLLSTNKNAGNFKVISVNFNNPAEENWKDIIPERKETLGNASMVGNKIFVTYLIDAASKVYQFSPGGQLINEIKLPTLGSAYGFGGFQDDEFLFYGFNSFTDLPSLYRYDLTSGKSEVFKTSEFAIDLNGYETRQVFYPSKDGTKIPVFLIHKKGLVKDGSHPTLLYAYGGFDISTTPYFWAPMFELLENNGVLAVANIRGGGEYGESWHKAGMLGKKQNVFDDFIAAANYLVDSNYCTREKLALLGGSNGGLLVGAVITQQPAICKVAFPEVGVMDMLRFQKFTSGVFWTNEYGSSDSASQFPFLYKYSPVHNVKEASYPSTLIITADHDDRVVPMHSFKFAATLQEKQKGKNPVLIRIETNQGHGGAGSSLKKDIESWTDIFSFMFYNMGITPA